MTDTDDIPEEPVLLKDRTAIIYGAGGSVGGAIARAFAREGAVVHLAGRTAATLHAVADDIAARGGEAHPAVVDALDEAQVEAHAATVAERSGRLDISVNVISDQDVQGTPMVQMSVEDYLRPIEVAVRSKFLTARAAARRMIPRRSGVIMTFGGTFNWQVTRTFHVGGMGTTFDAVESMRRQLACELGPHGIRVLTLRTGGLPDTIPTDFPGSEGLRSWLQDQTLTGRTATLDDVGNLAAFAASDLARTITGAALNMTAGAVLD
ncbi:MAG TPA: SDR family oxidoreductase [Actinophytocola sp.]|uniref:SDR family NAD(P)-dependent oxidoreductase n=1 Tax=Actinophytocola sp. TaxID=1872138 RepID=UPI002DB5FA9A|nr:SDR family oxidoreductase [Actinophytocola sp.]HEU5471357.1 SDR family oxidoreductase [Actinophytocola sp.]